MNHELELLMQLMQLMQGASGTNKPHVGCCAQSARWGIALIWLTCAGGGEGGGPGLGHGVLLGLLTGAGGLESKAGLGIHLPAIGLGVTKRHAHLASQSGLEGLNELDGALVAGRDAVGQGVGVGGGGDVLA